MAAQPWYATTAAALVFALVAVLAPGLALQRLLRLRIDPSLVLPLGFVFCSATYGLSLVTHTYWIFPVLVLLIDASLLATGRDSKQAEGPSLRGAILPFLAVVALFSFTQYPINRFDGRGRFLYDPCDTIDTTFHVGVTWELVKGYPPQIPGLAGVPMTYHFGSYLTRAASVRWAGLHPYDAMFRFEITLASLALILAFRRAAHVLGVAPMVVKLAGWIPLLTDLSFFLALLPNSRWWAARLYGNLIEGLFFANSMIPALAILLGALGAWARYRAHEGRGWLALAVLLGIAVPFFKLFFAPAFLLALGVAWLRDRSNRRSLLVMTASVLCATIVASLGVGGDATRFGIDPFNLANRTWIDHDLQRLEGAAFGAWVLFWIVASLGLRIFGILPAIASLRGREGPVVAFAVMALVGWPAASLLDLSAEYHNESGYFMEQSGPLLWLFALPVLTRFVLRARRPGLRAALCLMCCLPATVEYVLRKARVEAEVVPAPVVMAMRALDIVSRPDDVVIMRPESRIPPPPLALIGRRIPFTTHYHYQMQFTTRAIMHRSDRLVRRFFRSREPQRALAIARELDARFLYLTGRQRMRFDAARAFELLFSDEGERVYRIPRRTETPD
jgi:hypothetical protein